MRQAFRPFAFLFAGFLSLLVFAMSGSQEVSIESLESKTAGGLPVFNRIKYFKNGDQEIWMMNQSHHGRDASSEEWDRLAIVVDSSQSPKTARFYQLESGPLEWPTALKEKPFRISCFMCHNNGPRAIRPNLENLSARDYIQISWWNLKIKLGGRVVADPVHHERDDRSEVPFRISGILENQTLKVKTCVKCHKDEGFLARGALHLQQFSTIRHLVASGQMPPLGFHLSQAETSELEMFLIGL